ncbi:MAG: peptidylprolyl isomerase [Deltaproteobacteria bacterium]|nr:peptidylprolyl isomerase [Deltaproteobacteria bacterium]
MQGSRFGGRCVLLGALLLFQLVLPSVHANESRNSGKVVARVNDVPIYEEALIKEMAGSRRQSGVMGGQAAKAPDERQKMESLDRLIDAELFRQASCSQAVEDIEGKVANRFKEIRDKYPDENAFVASFQKRGQTLESYKLELREGIINEEYLRKNRITGVAVPDADIERFYRDNKKSFLVPEQIRVRHILVEVKGSNQEAAESAVRKAREIRERVIREKDFATVAKETSSCSSASNGGDLGFLQKGFMPAEFDKVAFSLKVEDVSEPVRTRHGLHIIQVLEKREQSGRPLSEVKEFIAKYLQRFAEKERLRTHMAELRKKAVIQISND